MKMSRLKGKDFSKLTPRICQGATLREEMSGKKEHDVGSILKLKHLQKLATWAGGDSRFSSLGALFGHRLSATAESAGIPVDQSCFQCQRCESILQPGFNCRIRIHKNKCKRKKGKKKARMASFQNSVIYRCDFCSHHNMIKGTRKGQLKDIVSSRELTAGMSSTNESDPPASQSNCVDGITSIGEPRTPVGSMQKTASLSTEKKKKKREEEEETNLGKLQLSGSSGQLNESGKQSSRKRRKGWSSLKDIAESKEAESFKSIANFVIPHFM